MPPLLPSPFSLTVDSMALRCYGFARTGEDAAYLASDIPLEQVEQGLAALKTLGVGGFNVTMPCRTAVAGLVDELPPAPPDSSAPATPLPSARTADSPVTTPTASALSAISTKTAWRSGASVWWC